MWNQCELLYKLYITPTLDQKFKTPALENYSGFRLTHFLIDNFYHIMRFVQSFIGKIEEAQATVQILVFIGHFVINVSVQKIR